ncbi:hypothetical protein RFI_35750 [Reticulomyxa filosa]|uniref:Uncharacterized protein n=1 Tax=Reticulomyxa filosa TaxID=46433 RepID=X6LLS7_RETFI|nr:hypothetical protein RFI_35750 [Reticulomyxa filosa]|eukprot:ETO01690.1 hypothetical protein RFI_35750 [Reticulomyxa filosa]
MNQQKSMAYLPESERQSLIDWIRFKLKMLANISSLEFTPLYGTRGTYVISAIIISVDNKLDQGKDWPLQIDDNEGTLQCHVLRKCKMLPGEYYDNIFIHFKPTDTTYWTYN